MENENVWAARGKEKKRERKQRRKTGRRQTSDNSWRTRKEIAGKRQKGETRERPRSCVAQRETFNSVTPGLNYHAETIVPGKIKKGAPPAGAVATFLLRRTAQNHPTKRERGRESRNTVKERRKGTRKTTTKSLFRPQDRLLRSV